MAAKRKDEMPVELSAGQVERVPESGRAARDEMRLRDRIAHRIRRIAPYWFPSALRASTSMPMASSATSA